LKIREITTGDKILITTFLCKKTTNAKIIKKLYKECKSPEMVKKEMWTHFLAYNIIRSLMQDLALYNKMLPRKISFKNSLQLYLHYLEDSTQIEYEKLLRLIGKKVIGNRGGRIEPRAIKKRHNAYPLLMKTRAIAKAEVPKNGHPKKK